MRQTSNKMPSLRVSLAILSVCFFGALSARAHKGHAHHLKSAGDVSAPSESEREQVTLRQISESYTRSVKSIFDQKCLDCHGGRSVRPWYYQVPGIRQVMDSDIAEATEHLDMSKGFPFGGHGSSVEDLEAISNVVKDGSMPPFSYRLMHPGSSVKGAEKDAVLEWVEASQKQLALPHLKK